MLLSCLFCLCVKRFKLLCKLDVSCNRVINILPVNLFRVCCHYDSSRGLLHSYLV